MTKKITPLLIFNGQAEEAMQFYISLFQNSEIKQIIKYNSEGCEKEGKVMRALFTMNGREYMSSDSNEGGHFTSTPALSLFADCNSEEELDRLFDRLSDGGKVLVPLHKDDFSKKFGCIRDKFGVSWQLNLRYESKDTVEGNVCFANNKEVRPDYRD